MSAGKQSPGSAELRSGRLVGVRELTPQPDGTHVCALPEGKVLINPTETELAIIAIYARECARLRPSVLAECQHRNHPPAQ